MSRRPTAMSSCALCAWRAQMTDDTEREVVDFLHRRLVDHLTERHPDHRITGPLPVIHVPEEERP